MIKRLMIILTVIVLAAVNLLMLSGCPKETEGFENGFSHLEEDVYENGIFIAVKSDKSIFDIDDITFDLYYGTTASKIPVQDENYEPICVAVYHQIGGGGTEVLFDDYKNSGRFQIIREISIEDFYSGDYAVTSELRRHILGNIYYYTFTHSEKFTLPKEYFDGRRTRFYFYASVVYLDKEKGKYFFSEHEYITFEETWSTVSVSGKLIEGGRVQL